MIKRNPEVAPQPLFFGKKETIPIFWVRFETIKERNKERSGD